jgi:hypothetical protein
MGRDRRHLERDKAPTDAFQGGPEMPRAARGPSGGAVVERADRDPSEPLARQIAITRSAERAPVLFREQTYELRASEVRTLATVGAFRVVRAEALPADTARDPWHGDLAHLRSAKLIAVQSHVIEGERVALVTLSHRGKALLQHYQTSREDGRKPWIRPTSQALPDRAAIQRADAGGLMLNRARILSLIAMLALVNACGGESPTKHRRHNPFFWERCGSVTIERQNQPASSGTTIWTFAVEPGTKRQTFHTSIQQITRGLSHEHQQHGDHTFTKSRSRSLRPQTSSSWSTNRAARALRIAGKVVFRQRTDGKHRPIPRVCVGVAGKLHESGYPPEATALAQTWSTCAIPDRLPTRERDSVIAYSASRSLR